MSSCTACNDPLQITIDASTDDPHQQQHPSTIPDDLELPCTCHFHWQCLLDEAPTLITTLTCPSCNAHLPSLSNPSQASSSSSSSPQPQQQILTRYTNEGGLQTNLDILPILTEEAFLTAHPSARPARALHTMVAEGDVVGLVDLLSQLDDSDSDEDEDDDDDEEPRMSAPQLLVWTDPLNGGKSALHVAVEARQEDVFWLLLWLGSAAPTAAFPAVVAQTAAGMGFQRRDLARMPAADDVRGVRDASGRTPADVCFEVGPPFSSYAAGGLFQ